MDSSSQSEVDAARAELQHFVYAASHDLQEPLRAIVAYSQLLERHLADDGYARDYISYIVGGANRMTALLRDLLTLSRGLQQRARHGEAECRSTSPVVKTSAGNCRASAEVTREDLPEVLPTNPSSPSSSNI